MRTLPCVIIVYEVVKRYSHPFQNGGYKTIFLDSCSRHSRTILKLLLYFSTQSMPSTVKSIFDCFCHQNPSSVSNILLNI